MRAFSFSQKHQQEECLGIRYDYLAEGQGVIIARSPWIPMLTLDGYQRLVFRPSPNEIAARLCGTSSKMSSALMIGCSIDLVIALPMAGPTMIKRH